MYFVLYDLNDNIICYFDNDIEFSVYSGLRVKDINYKFRHAMYDFVYCDIENTRFKLFRFEDCV